MVSSVASCMDMSLASHHFRAIVETDVELPNAIATTSRDRITCLNLSLLP